MESETRWSLTLRQWDNLDKMVERNPVVEILPKLDGKGWIKKDGV